MFFVCEPLYLEKTRGKTKLEGFNKIYLIENLVKYKRENNQLKNIDMDQRWNAWRINLGALPYVKNCNVLIFLVLCGSAQMVMQKYFPQYWSSTMPNTVQL